MLSGVDRNLNKLHPTYSRWFSPWTPTSTDSTEITGLITLHVRRGDYYNRKSRLSYDCSLANIYYVDCQFLASFANFEGWNLLPDLPDRFNPPSGGGDARTEYGFTRCWIEISAIVSRLDSLREEYGDLDRVFVSTNGDEDWVRELKVALYARGWVRVITTADLTLSWKQASVDSAIGEPCLAFGATLPIC